MKKLSILFVAVALLGFAGASMAQAQHNLVVTVSNKSEIALSSSGDVSLVLATATAGTNAITGTAAGPDLLWTANGSGKSITVTADQELSGVSLFVSGGAFVPDGGSADPGSIGSNVALTTGGNTFVTGANKCAGYTSLTYNGSATVEADVAPPDQTVVVTYTIGP